MEEFEILTDEFAAAAASAGLKARKHALAAGHSVIFVDDRGRYVEEMPDGPEALRLLTEIQPGVVIRVAPQS
jgi:hypothetical protein